MRWEWVRVRAKTKDDTRLAVPYLVASRCDTIKKIKIKTRKNEFQSNKIYTHPVVIYP